MHRYKVDENARGYQEVVSNKSQRTSFEDKSIPGNSTPQPLCRSKIVERFAPVLVGTDSGTDHSVTIQQKSQGYNFKVFPGHLR